MKYKLLIFDLDGTLADTSPGIINSHKHTNISMERPVPSDEELANFIGGPLLDTYRSKLGYSEDDAKKALQIYRKYYADHGIYELNMYPYMCETLAALKEKGYLLAVATLKAERLAIPLLNNIDLSKYFDLIHGVDDSDTRTKASLIEMCMNELNISKEETVLIGDSAHDANGAAKAGISFIAAKYGFGFKTPEELSSYNMIAVVKTPIELLKYL